MIPGVVKLAALLPATDAGKTKPLTAEPAMVVPGWASRSTVAATPASAVASANRLVALPALRTL